MDSKEAIAKARETWCTDDLEIDDEPEVARGEEGTWVAAWVWVGDES